MNSSPKILVFKLRSLIYTILLLFFAVLLIVCLILMFSPGKKKDGHVSSDTPQNAISKNTNESDISSVQSTASVGKTAQYIPGVYTASVSLGDSAADVEVTLNTDHIQAIRLVNLSEATEAAFPLVSPAFENISAQVLKKQRTDTITAPAENRYTSQLLLSAISDILQKAAATA